MVVLNKQDLHEATGQSVADREALSATLAPRLEQALGNPVTSIDVREGCGVVVWVGVGVLGVLCVMYVCLWFCASVNRI